MVTTNTSNFDAIWNERMDSIIVNINGTTEIINNSLDDIKFTNYKVHKKLYDSLLIYFDGKYNRYKKDVDFISVDIKENYAWSKNGVIKN